MIEADEPYVPEPIKPMTTLMSRSTTHGKRMDHTDVAPSLLMAKGWNHRHGGNVALRTPRRSGRGLALGDR